jgi:hypothetical protein
MKECECTPARIPALLLHPAPSFGLVGLHGCAGAPLASEAMVMCVCVRVFVCVCVHVYVCEGARTLFHATMPLIIMPCL